MLVTTRLATAAAPPLEMGTWMTPRNMFTPPVLPIQIRSF